MMALKAASTGGEAAAATSVAVGDINGNGKWKTKPATARCFFMWASSLCAN